MSDEEERVNGARNRNKPDPAPPYWLNPLVPLAVFFHALSLPAHIFSSALVRGPLSFLTNVADFLTG